MKTVVEINEVIKKPIQVVEKALAEGFNLYANMGPLKNVKQLPKEHSYTAYFKNEVLCAQIETAHITTSLSNNNTVNSHTDLKFIIRYLPHKISLVESIWYGLFFKPQLQYRTQHIIFDFKYRVEKWM